MRDKLISVEFLEDIGFNKNEDFYSYDFKIYIYILGDDTTEVHVRSDDDPKTHSTHFVNCRTENDLLELIRLL